MKTVKIALGGHPLLGDDVEYLQTAQTEGLITFLQYFFGDYVILTGVEYTLAPGNISWTAGWIYLQGELCQVDAGVAVYTTDNFWQIVNVVDVSGNRVYEDLNPETPFITRKATLTGSGVVSPYLFNSAKRLKAWRDWTPPTYSGDWAASGTSPQFGHNLIGEIVMRGIVINLSWSASTDTIIFTLPAGYVPAQLRTLIAPAIVNTVKTFLHIQIDVNGDVKPLGLTALDNVTIYLDGLRFLI